MDIRRLIPLFDPSVKDWALEARLLRWLTLLWVLVGIVILFSASYSVALLDWQDGLYYLKRQLFWICLGLICFNLLVNSPLHHLLKLSGLAVILFLGLIGVTLIPDIGVTVNGATRWLPLGSFLIQPSEWIKPFLVLQGARIFGQWNRLSWLTRLAWIGIFVLVLAAILAQPNLSTAAICGITLWLIALAAGLPYLYLGGAAVCGVTLGVLSITLKTYQRQRIISFLNPWADPSEAGYQLIQSLLAIGSGGILGTGFGLSQMKASLPIQHTDFIFAVYAEEFGFVGSLLLLLMLAAYATVALVVAIRALNPVHRLVAVGVTVLLVGQSLLNIGVATGALPTTGLPFPLFSYGGNSVIASLLAAALLIRVARESREADVVPLQPTSYSPRRRRRSRRRETSLG
ncbi:MAG: FtsW/RodA/SpoVE family cell cycle protein [Leptolyngbyaceae cyanobacterium MO_188.B28]|nr:FtsW/RodA/SpoVE family cell cycle protein [Leptolyngbyaceae cyanobacterium MO_188.B28]